MNVVWIHIASEFCTQHGNDFRLGRNGTSSSRDSENRDCTVLFMQLVTFAISPYGFGLHFLKLTFCTMTSLSLSCLSSNRRITCSLKSFSFPPTNRRALDFTTSLRSKCLSGIALWPCQIEVHTCCIRDACVSVSLQVCYIAGRVEQNLS
jgi:hypothetical protein